MYADIRDEPETSSPARYLSQPCSLILSPNKSKNRSNASLPCSRQTVSNRCVLIRYHCRTCLLPPSVHPYNTICRSYSSLFSEVDVRHGASTGFTLTCFVSKFSRSTFRDGFFTCLNTLAFSAKAGSTCPRISFKLALFIVVESCFLGMTARKSSCR